MISYFQNNRKVIAQFLIFTAAYVVLAKISLTFGISFGNVSPFWLPSGIAAAAVLVWKYPVIPGILAGTTLAVLSTEVSAATAVIFGCGNGIEALIFLHLYQRYGGSKISLQSPETTFRFIGISGVSCLFGGLIGVLTLFFQGYVPLAMVPLNLFTWWLGDLSGILLVTPFLVTWHSPSLKTLSRNEWIEYLGYYGVLLVGSFFIFSGTTPYLFLLFLLYAVFRFALIHVLVTIIIGDLIAVSLMLLKTGPFSGIPGTQNLLSIQLFMIITSITGLLLYSVVQERKNTLAQYKDLTVSLQDQITEQTRELKDSEVRFHELFAHMHSGVVIYSAAEDGEDFIITDLNQAAERIEGVVKSEIVGRSVRDVFPGVVDFGLFQIFQDVWYSGVPQRFPVTFYKDTERSGWRDNYVFQIPNGEIVAVYDDVSVEKETAENLEKAREWLKFTQKAAKAGSWDWDVQTGILTWSEEFYDLFALPSSALPTFETWLSVLHPDDRKPALDKINQDLEAKGDLWNEYRAIMPDGTERWIGSAGKAVFGDDGKPVRVSGICLDINTKKKTEIDLQKSEERLKYTLEAIDDGYWDWDIPSGTTFFNPRWYTLLGYEPYEMPESYDTFISLIHPDDRDRVLSKIADHFNHGTKPYAIEVRMLRKSGDYIWILTRGKVVTRDADFNPVRMVGTHTDITHRKKVEEALRESEERYRLLIENVPDIILVHREGIIQYVNPAAVLMMGYTREDLLNTPLSRYIAPEYIRTVMTAINQRIAGEDIQPYEIEIFMKSGERRTVVVRGSQIRYSGVLASLNVLTDITERKKIEDQLRDFNEKLEQEVLKRTEELNTSLSEKEVLLKEIHHRVKNNMQVISSLLFMQARSVTQQEVKDVLLESQNRIKSIALVHEKLYQSKDLDKIDYTDYLQKIAHHIFDSYRIDSHRISLDICCEPVFMSMDKAVPCSLIINELISNSLKYAFPEGRTGKISIELAHAGGKYIIHYQDTGVGIPDDVSFEHTRTLGLQLIHGLVGQLNGEISLDRTVGSKFFISFPE